MSGVRLALGTARIEVGRRSLIVGVAVAVLLLVTAVLTLGLGRLGIAPAHLLSALTGHGDATTQLVLGRLRGPRLLVAFGAGAALGLSGALFQSVTRNPLGSPDVIGVGAGAGAGAALTAMFLPMIPVWLGAVLGAGAAIGLVAVSTGTGLRRPGRMILAGIGVSAIAAALTQYVVYAALRDRAAALAAYLNGSLNARSWDNVLTITVVLVLCATVLPSLGRALSATAFGDETSAALGVDAGRVRRRAVLVSVVLAGGAVAVAGPIAFVALAAPHIARRLARSAGPTLLLSALVGALLLSVADVLAQHGPWASSLPVGVLTLAIGGGYLGFLLLLEWRKGTL